MLGLGVDFLPYVLNIIVITSIFFAKKGGGWWGDGGFSAFLLNRYGLVAPLWLIQVLNWGLMATY